MQLRLILLIALAGIAGAINFDLSPGKEECFFEEVHSGTQINGVFAVVDGTSSDIDVVIYNPSGKIVYEVLREGEGKFSVVADKDGSYKFCFINKGGIVGHRTVKMVITTGELLDFQNLAKKEHMDDVERWIAGLAHTVRMIDFHQQEYRILHERHLNTVISTNRRVKWWSFLECLAVFSISFLQVFFIKRLFRKPTLKRMV